jgi:anti-anti-sigma factor
MRRAEQIEVRAFAVFCSRCEGGVMSNVIDDIDRFGSLDIHLERDGDRLVIALAGELDMHSAERVAEELHSAEATDASRIVLDLSRLEFMDSSGLRVIVNASARSRRNGDRLELIRGPAAVQRVFELTALLDRLPFAA